MEFDKEKITSWFSDSLKEETIEIDDDSDGELPSMSAQFSFFHKEEPRDSFDSDEIDDEIESEPEKYDDSEITKRSYQPSGEPINEDRNWGLCPNHKGEQDKRLWIQTDKDSELIYVYRFHSKDSGSSKRYICGTCMNRGRYSKVVLYTNTDGTFTLYESSKHLPECEKTKDSITALGKRKYIPPVTH